ncbi:hypothetical protein HHI36_013078 [Cryptolaemus montrouzieri]|uniref:Uncharacterized protein n=1 Tax=Cryptolaemus montrouzieri TaxID=559131 RepID=A0ABD2NG48_9CUCU
MPRSNHLKSTELSYELASRNVDPPATVDEKRKLLNILMFKDNVKELKESIADITTLVFTFQGNSNSDEYKRISSSPTHVSQRVQHMSTEDDTEKKTKQDILRQVLLSEADVDEKVIVPTTPPVITNPVSQSTPLHPSLSPQSTSVKKVPVYKWGIKTFSGRESLVNFLELTDSLKSSRGCTDADLFESAGDLFEHEAWTFWQNSHINRRFNDW